MKRIIFSILIAVFIALATSSAAFAATADGKCLESEECASGKSYSDFSCAPTDVRCGERPTTADGKCLDPEQKCTSGKSYRDYSCTPTDVRCGEKPTTGGETGDSFSSGGFLDSLDPLKTQGSEFADQLSTPRGIISRVLEFAFPLAGIGMFVMIVLGGFQILTGAGEQKSMESGRQKITTAIVGFVLLFSSYWIAQILEQLFGIKIL